MVHNKNTKLAAFFVLIGAMMIVVPMLIEKVDAKTYLKAVSTAFSPDVAVFTKIIGKLDAGRWVERPVSLGDDLELKWITTGPLPFGGNEKGQVDADVVSYLPPHQKFGHVTLFWTNPFSGRSTCNVQFSGQVGVVCGHVEERGTTAFIRYTSTVR